MQQQERDLIADLFGRLQPFEIQPRDPEAERLIAGYVARQPAALSADPDRAGAGGGAEAGARRASPSSRANGASRQLPGSAPSSPVGLAPPASRAPAQPRLPCARRRAIGAGGRAASCARRWPRGGVCRRRAAVRGHPQHVRPQHAGLANPALDPALDTLAADAAGSALVGRSRAGRGRSDDYDLTSDDSGFDSSERRHLEEPATTKGERELATIELHTWGTPNGRKVSIMLEECGLPYSVHKVDISKGEQHKPEFLKISPTTASRRSSIPTVPGGKPISLFESGAILIYLADKTGKFLSKEPVQKYKTLEWLMWQMGGVGPMFGQAHHFLRAAPTKIEYGIKRYVDEAKRLYGVLDKQLAGNAYAPGADYSIADMAIFPWTRATNGTRSNLADFPQRQALVRHGQCAAGRDQGHGGSVPELTG
jgi:GST-like protein